MTTLQKLAAGAALLLAALPAPLMARRHSYRADPGPRDLAAVLIEDPSASGPAENFPKLSAEKSGTIPTKDGRSLRVNVDLGNVRVFTDESARISYRAIVEADSRDPGAEEFLRQFDFIARQTPWGIALDGKVPWQGLRGRFSATIEIHIPRRYNLEVSTGGGNIEVQDIDGRIRLTSAGGNINVGRVGGGDGSERDAARNKSERKKRTKRQKAPKGWHKKWHSHSPSDKARFLVRSASPLTICCSSDVRYSQYLSVTWMLV